MQLRVVIFEDDEVERRRLGTVVEQLGHQVLAFADPMACPLYWDDDCDCRQEHPCGDLLITDNRMPRMTGLEFVRRQCERGCKGVAANKAVISGSWTGGQLAEARRLGCRVFAKPLATEDVAAWVEERAAEIPPDRRLAPMTGSVAEAVIDFQGESS